MKDEIKQLIQQAGKVNVCIVQLEHAMLRRGMSRDSEEISVRLEKEVLLLCRIWNKVSTPTRQRYRIRILDVRGRALSYLELISRMNSEAEKAVRESLEWMDELAGSEGKISGGINMQEGE